MILTNQKKLFTIPQDIVYLNCANMSPLLKSAEQAGIKAIIKRTNPWRYTIDDWFQPAEELKKLFAAIIQADSENIALIPSVSYGIATAAKNIRLNPNQKIVLLDQEYPSNFYAWRELSKQCGAEIITVKRQPEQSWTETILETIDTNTGVVSIPNCHWTDGSKINLELVSKKVKSIGGSLVIDASQSLGAYPLNIKKVNPDFLVTVGYKWLLGPYGLGYLYADQKHCETGMPIEYTWLTKTGSEDFTSLVDYRDEYKKGARRFDAGEFPGFIHIPMAIATLTQILGWGVENIQETLRQLTNKIEERSQQYGFVTPGKDNRVGHMIGAIIPECNPSVLDKELKQNQVYVSFRGSGIRVAPHLYNEMNDIEKLFQVLAKALKI